MFLKPEVFDGKRLDREIAETCDKITFVLPRIPWGRRKRSLDLWKTKRKKIL